MIVTISTAAALIAVFVLGYGLRGEREQTKRRALTEHAATLEAANALLRDQLRAAYSTSEHHAEGLTSIFEQSMLIYSSRMQPPYTPRAIGGGGD